MLSVLSNMHIGISTAQVTSWPMCDVPHSQSCQDSVVRPIQRLETETSIIAATVPNVEPRPDSISMTLGPVDISPWTLTSTSRHAHVAVVKNMALFNF